MRQRVWCARNVISLASDVPKQKYLTILLSNLQAPVIILRNVAAAALHQLSSTNLGALPCIPMPCHLALVESAQNTHSCEYTCL